MARGGYRPPHKPAAVSGPGKMSKRTDGQPAMAPDLDTPGQNYGDRQAQMEAQRRIPLSNAGTRSGPGPQRNPSPLTSAGVGRDQALADIFQTPTRRGLEPPTAGLDMGPGPGSEALAPPPPQDEREMLLQRYADRGNSDAAQLLQLIRQQSQPQRPMPMAPMQAPTEETQEPPGPEEPEPGLSLGEEA